MIRLLILIAAMFFATSETMKAQELSYGFRVGLNQSTFFGDDEADANGNSLENLSFNSGFHVGGGVRIEFTELFGIRTEILFTQKGTKQTFDGPSYLIFRDGDDRMVTTGNKNISLNISNAYLEFPIMAYGKIGNSFEVFGGGYFGFLVSSIASGEVIYTDGRVEGNNNVIERLELALDHNYLRDEPGELISAAANIDVMVGNDIVQIPNTLTAYYDMNETDGNPYKVMDAGLSAGAAYFLNGGLYFSAIVNYGLIDVSRTNMDFSKSEINGLEFITRDDKDSNFSLQFSIGFSF